MNNIVKYDNSFNEVALRNFNKLELNLLMGICSRVRDKGTNKVEFTFEQLKALVNYDTTNNKDRFVKDLQNTYKKIITLDFKLHNTNELVNFVLFTSYKIDVANNKVSIKVNEDFSFILNEITSNFTRFELTEFVNLRSTYSKECYRRLKQFRQTGKWIVEIDEFRKLLDIPESYRMSNIDQKVLQPIIKELRPIFKGLRIDKLVKKGRKITHLEFTFYKEEVVSIKKIKEEEAKILSYDWLSE